MNDLSGADVEWQNQDGNTYDQKLGAVLASSNMPDVVVVPGWNMGGKIPSAIIGKFTRTSARTFSGDKVEDYPNLAGIPSDAWQRCHLRWRAARPMPSSYVANIRVPSTARTSSTRRDTEVPTSADEFMALAEEITNAKAKRWACLDMKWTAFNAWGVLSGSEKALGWNMVDGKLIYRVETQSASKRSSGPASSSPPGTSTPLPSSARAGAHRPSSQFAAGEFLIYNQDISQWWSRTAEQATQNPTQDLGHGHLRPRRRLTDPLGGAGQHLRLRQQEGLRVRRP